MAKTIALCSAALSDPGRVRAENQDRVFIDEERGLFLVVDGLGGHAAGEKAAEAAVQAIADEIGNGTREAISRAIAAANNRIFEEAASNDDWRGMACVLTLAVFADDGVIVGHVGDSRLYLIWNGVIRKITSDHSPVGEREDSGELTEAEAMVHPRRHEVFRDVGSRHRTADEADFIEVKEFSLKPDAALLLCSDGLSDLVAADGMLAIVERYDGDPDAIVGQLIDAANARGGTDNISAIFVAGQEFLGNASPEAAEARERNAITKARDDVDDGEQAAASTSRLRRGLTARGAFLIYGFILGMTIALALSLALRWPKP